MNNFFITFIQTYYFFFIIHKISHQSYEKIKSNFSTTHFSITISKKKKKCCILYLSVSCYLTTFSPLQLFGTHKIRCYLIFFFFFGQKSGGPRFSTWEDKNDDGSVCFHRYIVWPCELWDTNHWSRSTHYNTHKTQLHTPFTSLHFCAIHGDFCSILHIFITFPHYSLQIPQTILLSECLFS